MGFVIALILACLLQLAGVLIFSVGLFCAIHFRIEPKMMGLFADPLIATIFWVGVTNILLTTTPILIGLATISCFNKDTLEQASVIAGGILKGKH